MATDVARYGPDIPTEAELKLCGNVEGKRVLELGGAAQACIAFVRADSIDLAFSSYAFDEVDDLNRVFRQVHRVLRQEAPLVFSVSHPSYAMIDDAAEDPLLVRRSYFERSTVGEKPHRTISELFTGLVRANYRVDTILEPAPASGGPRSSEWHESFKYVPRTLIIRARKEGI